MVWIIAAILSCPPLFYGHFRLETVSALDGTQVEMCTPMTSADWYIIFSAFISFILPMILMVCCDYIRAIAGLILSSCFWLMIEQ